MRNIYFNCDHAAAKDAKKLLQVHCPYGFILRSFQRYAVASVLKIIYVIQTEALHVNRKALNGHGSCVGAK